MFNKIDTWLVRQHQNIANWSDVRFGKNCYWWGYLLTELLCPVIFAQALLCFVVLAESMLVASMMVALWFYILKHEFFELRVRRQTANSRLPFKLTNGLPRVVYFGLLAFNIPYLLTNPSSDEVTRSLICTLFLSRSYFDACLPMPPYEKEQKRAELFDGVPESA